MRSIALGGGRGGKHGEEKDNDRGDKDLHKLKMEQMERELDRNDEKLRKGFWAEKERRKPSKEQRSG